MDIERIGVIGAGQMGTGIARVAAEAGFSVRLLDIDISLAQRACERIHNALAEAVAKRELDDRARQETLARICAVDSINDLSDAQLIVEAVVEDLLVKTDILRQAEAVTEPHAILSSHTSSISITQLANTTKRPDRFIGLRFMNPPTRMKAVEITRGLLTSEGTTEQVREAVDRMGKVGISHSDLGFSISRVLLPFLYEACIELQEGIAAEDIDSGARLGLNHPMGPLELADLIGLDTVLHIGEQLHHTYGHNKYRPPVILSNYVAAGWLGRKTGRGFYCYPTLPPSSE